MFRYSVILALVLFSFAYTQNANINIIYNEDNNSIDVYMINDVPLSGFQFNISGVNLNGANGGITGDYNYTVVASYNGIVLGFNPENIQIPIGDHLLTQLIIENITSESACMSDLIFVTTGGELLTTNENICVDLNNNDIEGCTDTEAINYNAEANVPCYGNNSCCVYDDSVEMNAEIYFGSLNSNIFTIPVMISNDAPISGFQFDINNINIESLNGGIAEESGFTVQSGLNNIVIGFNASGNQIPSGSHLLTNINFTSVSDVSLCIDNLIVVGANGNLFNLLSDELCLDVSDFYIDCNGDIGGGADFDDCGVCSGGNSNHLFNSDMDCAGVCFGESQILNYYFDNDLDGLGGDFAEAECNAYANPNYVLNNNDVDDDCYTNFFDCEGVCDGPSFTDDCGICSGGNTNHVANSDMDCYGDCFGDAYLDDCGMCAGGNTGLEENIFKDCNGDCFGSAFIDQCDVCSSGNTGVPPNSNIDCFGECFGSAFFDDCGMCAEGSTGLAENLYQDCNGDCYGSASLDDCGICSNGNTGNTPNNDKDCNGDCFGDAFVDDCGLCVEGNTGLEQDLFKDCNGDCFGNAEYDDCGICSNGNSNHEFNSDMDCTGECFGDALIDCNNVCDGLAIIDDCDICSGGSTGNIPNNDKDCNGDCFGLAIIDDCGVCSEGATNLEFNQNQDCNGDCFGLSVIDDCGVCSGGNSNHIFNSDIDCVGSCFGSAVIDDCGICSGGESGNIYNSNMDCMGLCFGSAIIDDCSVCSNGTSGHEFNSDIDCNNDCFGGAIIDECGICSEGLTGNTFNFNMDCTGLCFGSAFIDDCGVCSGSNTNHEANSDIDCSGECFGDAIVDDCNLCTGANTGIVYNQFLDCSSVCFGDAQIQDYFYDIDGDGLGGEFAETICDAYANSDYVTNSDDIDDNCDTNVYDCANICNGISEIEEYYFDNDGDELGYGVSSSFCNSLVPDGWVQNNNDIDDNCFSNIFDCADVCDGVAIVDLCDICSGGTTNHIANSDIDCSGECFGNAIIDDFYYDNDGDGLGGEFALTICSAFANPNYVTNNDDLDDTCFSNIFDCEGVCDGLAFLDDCNVCSGGTTSHNANSDLDCNGDCFGLAIIDDCGVCTEGYSGNIFNEFIDCNGDCFGDAEYDDCGICSNGNSNHDFNIDMDCSGVCFGEAIIDDCGMCSNGDTGLSFNYAQDCNGDCFGFALVDDCGVCSEGYTGYIFNESIDCNGDCFGSAFIDLCGICSSGNSGHIADSDVDCFGDCFGDAFVDDCGMCAEGNTGLEENLFQDCNGDCLGSAFLDDCGICAEGNTGLEENFFQDCNGDCFGSAFIDDCEECISGNTGLSFNYAQDCEGVCFGDSYVDNCGVCDDDNLNDCVQDCAGIWGGFSYIDNCGICDDNESNDCVQDCAGEWGGNAYLDMCGVCDDNAINDNVECTNIYSVYYNTDLDISAFQFLVNGPIVSDVSLLGGAAIESDFLINFDPNNVVLGVSLQGSGSVINTGEGILINLITIGWDDFCISEVMLSFSDGTFEVNTDVLDCNTISFCSNDIDDDNVCDGIDECIGFYDECGVCNGDNSDCIDCAGVPNGNAYYDECNVCDDNPLNDCVQDCAGVWGGGAYEDNCFDCDDDPLNDCVQDCNGLWGGDAVLDECGVCDGQGIEDGQCDCLGNILDECGICAGSGLVNWFWDDDGDGYGDSSSIILFCPNAQPPEGWVLNNEDLYDTIYCLSNTFIGLYYDLDLDGLGCGDEIVFCEENYPEDWVQNNDDLECECSTNDTDLCGVCGGDNQCAGCIDESAFNFDEDAQIDCLDCCIYKPNYPYDWEVNPSEFSYNGSINAKVIEMIDPLDFNIYGSENDFLAAFYEDELRGVSNGLYNQDLDEYRYFLMTFSNDYQGDRFTLQYYNFEQDSIYVIDEQIEFESDMILGNSIEPLVLHFDNGIPDWNFNIYNFEFNGSVTSEVFLEGLPVGNTSDILAGFVGDEVRGYIRGLEAPEFIGGVVFYLLLYSNEVSGEQMNFKFYDSTTNQIYEMQESVEFVSDMIVGNLGEPFQFNWDFLTTAEINLSEGWNWFSFNVVGNSLNINNVLSSLNEGLNIKSQTGFSTFYPEAGQWFGTLDSLSPFEGYKLFLTDDDILNYTGVLVDPETPFEIQNGWNWIGYLPDFPLNIDDALSSLSYATYIKNQQQFSDYIDLGNEGQFWFGTLDTLYPYNAYVLQSSEDDTLKYIDDLVYDNNLNYNSFSSFHNKVENLVDFNYREYEYNGSLTATINIEDGNNSINSNDLLIAYIDNDCRGYVNPYLFPLSNNYVFPIMLYSSMSEESNFKFKYYDSINDSFYNIQENIVFTNDMMLGDALNPVLLTLDYQNSLIDLQDIKINKVFPNPFNPVTNIEYKINKPGNLEIKIFNINGKIVESINNVNIDTGVYNFNWNASDFSSGIYFINFEINETSITNKVILIK